MRLEKIRLDQFRNFSKKEYEFNSGLNLVVGPNAVGKTNLLEAVFLLATGRSFRGGRSEELITRPKQVLCRVVGWVENGEPVELEVNLSRGEVGGIKMPKKRLLVNKVPRRLIDFSQHLEAVLFRPEDMEIVIGSPSCRRDFLDLVLEASSREYFRVVRSYQKGLRQRNRLLDQIRDGNRDHASLFFWNKLLLENGQKISQAREEFISYVNERPDYFGDLVVEYDQNVISPERLEKYQSREIGAGMTLVGPHRDNLIIKLQAGEEEARELAIYGSRGEQRLAVFSLKLAQLEFIAEKKGQRPILLLDDIFSELDQANRELLLAVIPKQQTILTGVDLQLDQLKFLSGRRVISLREVG
ncbi:DNA replication and repair protein RecF [Patescibacteria group bacterium]|nr:DNA replication and repair protein RecF [Patescibacteria group bacterium]